MVNILYACLSMFFLRKEFWWSFLDDFSHLGIWDFWVIDWTPFGGIFVVKPEGDGTILC